VDHVATYSFVISISQTEVKPNVKGGGFLPPTAQYLDPYSKRPEAVALLAGLSWIQNLLHQYPNHTGSNPPPLLIPVNNEGVGKDVHRTSNEQTPTFDLLSPDFDILQAIRTTLNELPIRTETSRTLRHTKTVPSCGIISTFVKKLMCLLTNKLTTSTKIGWDQFFR
jgi:hypothetical protein